jgi:hypothetical protein
MLIYLHICNRPRGLAGRAVNAIARPIVQGIARKESSETIFNSVVQSSRDMVVNEARKFVKNEVNGMYACTHTCMCMYVSFD